MNILDTLLDDAFERARENGTLDDLPGTGKPLKPGSLTADPFAHVYAESEVMTPFGTLQRQIDAGWKRLATVTDLAERKAIQTEIAALETRKAVEMETYKRYT